MSKVKSIITAVLCGLSTFNIMPTTDYSQYYTRDARVLSFKAWKRTGNNLRKTIEDFEGYNKIDLSFVDRIIADFEKNSEYSREMEKRDLLARIERDKRGQYMALIVAILLLGIVAYSLYRGNITFA